MSIRYDSNLKLRLVIYEELLKSRIIKISNKAKIDVNNINFVIYDANNYETKGTPNSILEILLKNNPIYKEFIKNNKYP